MNAERRYNEEEIAAIFRQAAADHEAAQQSLPLGGGLTLAEIEQIGKEVGITPEFIARAAATVEQPVSAPAPTTSLGLPVSVARVVDLPGSFTDEDWDRLVADLHETYQVHGEVRRDGSLRQWRHENFQVLVEPTASGYRLRLRSLSELFRFGLPGGLLLFVMGLVFMLLVAAKGDFGADMGKTLFTMLFAAAGLAGMGAAAYSLPGWRKEQQQKMDIIAARAVARVRLRQASDLGESEKAESARSGAAPLELDAPHRSSLDLPAEEEPAEQAPGRRKTRA